MSAPWHSALRAVHFSHRRNTSLEWEQCHAVEECRGIALAEADGRCFAHAAIKARIAASKRMATDGLIDVRGTTLTMAVMSRLLLTVRQDVKESDLRDRGDFEIDFRGCRFPEEIDFSHRRILPGRIDFSDAVFESNASFTGARFSGMAVFESTHFHAGASFDEAVFERPAWFLRTISDRFIDFSDAKFSTAAYFHQISAKSSISFVGASFSGPAFLEPVRALSVDFSNSNFTHRAVFQVYGSCVFDGARLEHGMELRVHSHADAHDVTISLRRAHFGAASTVASSLDVPVEFDGDAIENAGQIFKAEGGLPRLLSLRDSDVTNLGLIDIDLGNCLFAGAQNLDKLRLEGYAPFARMPTRLDKAGQPSPSIKKWQGREVLAEELLWRWQMAPAGSKRKKKWAAALELDITRAPSRRATMGAAQLATLYRALRKAREDAKNEPGAGDFYYGEQQARRLDFATRPFERLLLTAYWVLSGYGQRAGRALAALVVLVTAVTALLVGFGLPDGAAVQRMTGTVQPALQPGSSQLIILDTAAAPIALPPADQRWTAERWGKAARIVATSVARDSEQRLTSVGQWTLLIGRALGVILLALAVLAIRARVRR